jgi:hypothetical protein
MATLKVSEAKMRKKAKEFAISPAEKRKKSTRAKNVITTDRIGWRWEPGYSRVSIHESFFGFLSDKEILIPKLTLPNY